MKKQIILSLSLLLLTGQLFAQQDNIKTLNLLQPTNPTSFVFIGNGYWDKTFNDMDYTYFQSQVYSFSHLIEGAGSSYGGLAWNGFTVCNSGDHTNHNSQGWMGNYEWGCMAGGGIMTDADGTILKDENGDVLVQQGLPYIVGYWNYLIEPEWWHLGWGGYFLDAPTRCFQIHLDDDDEYEAVGVYVNIHPWTYYSNIEGFGSARPLNQPGDYFKLIIHGLNPDGTESGNSVEHFFAKYENGQLTQSTKWEWVSLSSLGEIGGFYCTMASTDGNEWGPLSPMYFCMDKLQVRIKGTATFVAVTNITNLPNAATVGEPLILTGKVMPEDATNQTITWSIESTGTTGATIAGNIFSATGTGTAKVKATIANGIAVGEDYTQTFDITVGKASQIAPPAPTLDNCTATSITLNIIAGCEYRMDGGAWQTSATFSELTPNTTYSFEAYKPETETHFASNPSPTAQFSTQPLGIEELGIRNYELRVYPNPTSGELTIDNGELTIDNVEIFDIYGKKLCNYQLSIVNYQLKINISHLPAGIYFVKLISQNNTTKTFKIIKE